MQRLFIRQLYCAQLFQRLRADRLNFIYFKDYFEVAVCTALKINNLNFLRIKQQNVLVLNMNKLNDIKTNIC